MDLPDLGSLIGPMLSASDDVVHASGAGVEAGVHWPEEYWRWRGASRLAADGRVVTSGPEGTRVRMPNGYADSTPRPSDWLGWTDRLLHPRHLYLWGRTGEDWRLGDVIGWSREVEDTVEVSVHHLTDGRVGAAHVHPASGRVMSLSLPGWVTWELTSVDDAPDVGAWPLRRWFEGVLPNNCFS
ncbi:hypothetical protein [Nocardioides campestrisoli]|uniref:hypothetical protein n=1 Tax=Nocardioides campestrisoli TaxID=2736757 RepID=UPI00163DB804|nr:hypothetical protein [Nocardioides campestrisoli]